MRSLLIFTAVSVGALLFVLERFLPLRSARHSLAVRMAVNLAFSAMAFATFSLVIKPATAALLPLPDEMPLGLVSLIPLPPAASFVLGFLLMDLSFYYWHVANHKIPLFWRFHNVHHSDTDLDVTTALRFHFGELALSAAFRIVQLGIIGISTGAYVVYEIVFHGNTLFHHSNVRLPIRVERPLNALLVTPRMHGIHHSQVKGETNSNFSVVLPWWDRVHRTLRLNVPQSEIVIGVPAYSSPADLGLWAAITAPFRKQRDYWRRMDGTEVERTPAACQGSSTQLAE